jgi:WD40 repeat protein
MSTIFISFRKADARWLRERVHQTLTGRFGADQVFQSGASITPGTAFPDALLRQAAECRIMLVLIGPGWLFAADDTGQQQLLHRDEDWVRREIRTAMGAGNLVIPVLLGDATMLPAAAQLPADIAGLATLQFLRIPDTQPEPALENMVSALAGILPGPVPAAQPEAPSPVPAGTSVRHQTTVYGGSGSTAVNTGKHGISVAAEAGATVHVVQKIRRWAVANPALAVTATVALLGGGGYGTFQAISSASASPQKPAAAQAAKTVSVPAGTTTSAAASGTVTAVPIGSPLDEVDGKQVLTSAFSPDGHVLAVGSGNGDGSSGGGAIRLWNMADPAHPTQLGAPLTGFTNDVLALAFSPDGHTLVGSGWDHSIRLWNVTDPAHAVPLGQPLTGFAHPVWQVAFSSDGRTIAATDEDNWFQLWNVADPARPVMLAQTDTGSPVSTVAFSPDGRTLATSTSGQVQLWNVADPSQPVALGLGQDPSGLDPAAVVFSPDGHTLAVGGQGGAWIQLWNVSDPAHPARVGRMPIGAEVERVTTIAFSPDGHTLASGETDHTTRLWDVADPTHPTAIGLPLRGHTDNVYTVVFSPDGRILASGSRDHTITLWAVTPGSS